MRKWLIYAPNEFTAEIICQRLSDGGVRAIAVGSSAKPTALAGGRDIYVEEEDLDDARRILKSAEVSDGGS